MEAEFEALRQRVEESELSRIRVRPMDSVLLPVVVFVGLLDFLLPYYGCAVGAAVTVADGLGVNPIKSPTSLLDFTTASCAATTFA